ncbi:MAG: OmpH family outer membrane protein [Kiritimatiellae bacterium]|nr:OmpH family outer membrane protein [Kiritimatiellia bacterium]
MKKVLFASVCMLAAFVSADTKIGTVNLEILIKNHPSHESNRTLVKSTADDYRKKMESRQERMKSLVEEGKKFQSDWQNPMLSASAKADLQKKIEDVQKKLYAVQQEMRAEDQRYQEELADLQQRLFKIEKKDVEEKLAEFAKEGGYDLILDQAACGYAKPSLDVTDSILKKMGVKNPKK